MAEKLKLQGTIRSAVRLMCCAALIPNLAVAKDRTETAIVDHCTSTDLWRVERGNLVLDTEIFAFHGASLHVTESGVYERVAPVDECVGFSWLVFPQAKQPIKLVGHLRDRDRAHYILETRILDPTKNWKQAEFTLEAARLAPWSIDLNHRLDFPLYSVGLMVTVADGESINLDRLSIVRSIGPTEKERVIREQTVAWSRKLSMQVEPDFRDLEPSPGTVTFSEEKDSWVITSPYYRVHLDPRSAAPTRLEFGPGGSEPLPLRVENPWLAITWEGNVLTPGAIAARKWEPKLKILSVKYKSNQGISGDVRYVFHSRAIEMQLRIRNRTDHVIRWIRFPGEMEVPVESIHSLIWPRLGGVELLPSFFEQGRFSRASYPADGFADFLALRMKGRTLAFGTVQTEPLFQSAEPVVRGNAERRTVGYLHDVPVFIPPNAAWTPSPMTLWFARTAEEALERYREANRWDESPSLRQKLGSDLFDQISRAPLLKWDFELLSKHFRSGVYTFSDAPTWAKALPGSFLIHPVSYWNPPGRGPKPDKIFDQNHPNFLPAAEQFGGDAQFCEFIKETRSLGHAVAPYINPTAWGKYASDFEEYGDDIAILGETGKPHWGWEMYSADPYHPRVRQRLDELTKEFTSSHYVDLLFEDQVGARSNYLNLRTRAPHPLAYTEGWIQHAKKTSEKIPLMTERGFDALIPYESAFCGVELGLACTRYMEGWEWNNAYGEGNWRVFPLEAYLCHDKCALYHHDLGQFVLSDYDLAWCLVKGYNLQMHYPGDEQWLAICQAFQEAVGPYMFGEPLRDFEYLTDRVVRSRFPRLKVVANFHPTEEWTADGEHRIPPNGVLVVGDGGRLRAGVVENFHGVPLGERRYVIEHHYGARLVFRDVLPSGERYRLPRHLQWREKDRVRGEVITGRGRFPLEIQEIDDSFEFDYPDKVGEESVLRAEFRAQPRP